MVYFFYIILVKIQTVWLLKKWELYYSVDGESANLVTNIPNPWVKCSSLKYFNLNKKNNQEQRTILNWKQVWSKIRNRDFCGSWKLFNLSNAHAVFYCK